MGVIIIDGSTGGGKSHRAVKMALAALEDGQEVYTNIEMKFGSPILHTIERDVLDSWMDGKKAPGSREMPGPWDLPKSTTGAVRLLILDEAHLLMGQKEITDRWVKWFKEHRHGLWEVILITPHLANLDKGVIACAESRIAVFGGQSLRVKWTGITYGEFFDLAAAWTKRIVRAARYDSMSKTGTGRWRLEKSQFMPLDPAIFEYYESFSGMLSAPGGDLISMKDPRDRGRIEATIRFIRRNFNPVLWRLGALFMFVNFIFVLYTSVGNAGQIMNAMSAPAVKAPQAPVTVKAPPNPEQRAVQVITGTLGKFIDVSLVPVDELTVEQWIDCDCTMADLAESFPSLAFSGVSPVQRVRHRGRITWLNLFRELSKNLGVEFVEGGSSSGRK